MRRTARGRSESGNLLTRRVLVPRWAIATAIFLVALLATLFWSVVHRNPTNVSPMEIGSFRELLPSIAGATQGGIVEGNRAEVLQNGEFFERLIRDVDAATDTVHFETYVWWRGEICTRVGDAFARAAGRGVEVRVLLDALGARKMSEEIRRTLENAGVTIEWYHPVRLDTLGTLNNRDHRKTAVVDGRIGYTFGHGVAREWDHGGSTQWRDTAVRIEGPLVAALQSTFLDNWIATSAEVPVGESVFPELEPAGPVRGHVVTSSSDRSYSRVELLYELAIASAEEEILIQNPYFAPDTAVVDLLKAAVQRGVRVRLMLPGPEVIDSDLVLHVSHTYFGELLEAGVEILEYRPAFLHKKVMVVDRIWSHIGSTNFDSRSLEINDEVSVGLIDSEVAATLVEAFEADARECRVVDVESWNRSWGHRLLDRAAATLQEQI